MDETTTFDDVADCILDLPIEYAFCAGGCRRFISLSSIRPTQAYVLESHVQHYMHRRRHTSEGKLPWGLRFAGERIVYLVDGHHRFEASRRKERRRMWMIVDDVDEPLATILKRTAELRKARATIQPPHWNDLAAQEDFLNHATIDA